MGQRRAIWICAIILTAAAALRVAGTFNNFWIDEIISWDIARSVTSPLQIFTSVHHDNNHHLNTLWMYLLGDRQKWIAYRLLSVATGTIAVGLMGLLAAKSGTRAAIIATILGATSYFLVQYSSEARGYAPATMFALACALLLDRYLNHKQRSASLAFAACAILGLLSHLSFLYVYLGLSAWSFVTTKGSRRDLVRLHGLIVVFIIALYVIDVRAMTVAAGPIFPRWRVILDSAAWTTGLSRTTGWSIVAAAIVLAGLLAGTNLLWKQNRGEAIFYGIAIFVGPALMLLLWRQPYVYPRYFLLCVPFFLVLVARVLARMPIGVSIVLVSLFVIGNAINITNFYRIGRGDYLAALRYMVDNDSGNATTIGALQDRRNELMVKFYQRHLLAGETVRYVADAETAPLPPRWLIVDSVEGLDVNLAARVTPGGTRYVFDREFRYAGLSGMNWYVFKRVD